MRPLASRLALILPALLLLPAPGALRPAAASPQASHTAPSSRHTQPSHQASSLSGVVVDSSGGVIPGALVRWRGADGEQTTVTDAQGRFTLPQPVAATGTLTVVIGGFAPARLSVGPSSAPLRIVLEPLSLTETVTVQGDAPRTAASTRSGIPARDVPQSMTLISRDLIADQAMDGMADVVAYVPGVGMAQGEGHRDAPIFRGNTSTSDFFVDGLRDDTQYVRDLYNVERIEVLKGPNGLLFGRGGIGGVINRVTRRADWSEPRELSLQIGSWSNRRVTADLGHAFGASAAARITGMYENSDSYRDTVGVERLGVNPTTIFALGPATTLQVGYEFFHDERTTDRGVPSFGGRPLETDPSTFFGSATLNRSEVTVHALSSSIEHRLTSRLRLRNQTRYADYDKFYRNVLPGAVDAARTTVALTAYDSSTDRRNFFNQTDLVLEQQTGRVGHRVLAGLELGRQATANLRRTGYFTSLGPAVTTAYTPLANPLTSLPVEFRSSPSDANNDGTATTAAIYVQDQVAVSSSVQAIVGLRYDRFTVDMLDRRNGATLTGDDHLISPQLGIVYKPAIPVSLYASYARSSLPRAGEQLASLSPTTQALDPETFRNYEVGAKWDAASTLSVTTAVYRLVHGNVLVRDPNDATVSHLVDGARTTGYEIEISGRVAPPWTVHGGYAYQDAEIVESDSPSRPVGARLGQVPRHTFALWNRYDPSPTWGVGLGVISRSDSYVATDNAVVLPGFTRVDAALFLRLTSQLRAQVNVENLFDTRYYWAAHSNNNIAPGSPRALRVTLSAGF
jgi:catecholate siderophore receptor